MECTRDLSTLYLACPYLYSPIQPPRPLRIGVAQGRAPGRGPDAQMRELSLAALEPSFDFAKRLGLGELAEEHGDELVPRPEALAGLVAAMLVGDALEKRPIDDGKYLAKQAACPIHDLASVDGYVFVSHHLYRLKRRHFSNAVLDTSGALQRILDLIKTLRNLLIYESRFITFSVKTPWPVG